MNNSRRSLRNVLCLVTLVQMIILNEIVKGEVINTEQAEGSDVEVHRSLQEQQNLCADVTVQTVNRVLRSPNDNLRCNSPANKEVFVGV